MSLTLVATPGAANANAYADVAAATAVATYRVGGSAAAWLALTPDQQIQTLVTATRDLDTVTFRGARATTTQALEWPRTGTAYGSAVIPAPISMATIELAFSYASSLTTDVLNPADPVAQGIKREKVGPLETEYRDPTLSGGVAGTVPYDPRNLSRFPSIVQRLLAPLVIAAAAAGWGSAVAVRSS